MFRATQWGLMALAALSPVSKAYALPLLAENAGIRFNEVLTLYPDSNDPNVFYFMPNSSGIVFDERTSLPQIGFTYWGLSTGGPLDQAGAWLTFSMRLKSDAAQRAALDSLLAEGKRIAVLPVQESTISLTSTKDGTTPGARLFEEFHFSQRAGRAEDEVGVNAVMTGLGAKVFKAAMDNPQLLKVDYCYKVTGLGPNMEGKIHVKWDKVYEFFQASYSSGWLFRKTIALEVEKLRQQNLVWISLDGGDATEWEKLRELTNTIITRLFVPELQANPGSSEGGGGWSFSRFKAKAVRREELKEETWHIRKRDLIDREFCADMAVKDLTPYKDKIVRDADAN